MKKTTGEPVDACQVKRLLYQTSKAETMKLKSTGSDLSTPTQNKANEEMECVD